MLRCHLRAFANHTSAHTATRDLRFKQPGWRSVPSRSAQLAATLVHPESGLALDILTTAPTLVLYTGEGRRLGDTEMPAAVADALLRVVATASSAYASACCTAVQSKLARKPMLQIPCMLLRHAEPSLGLFAPVAALPRCHPDHCMPTLAGPCPCSQCAERQV